MISILYHLDKDLFYFINGTLGNPLFDKVMPWFRNMYFWFPLYAIIIGYIVYHFRKQSVLILLMVALTIVASDQLSGNLIKNQVKRLRPCNNGTMREYAILRIEHCGNGYSFVSAHASNHFALAVLMIFLFARRHRWVWWAAPLWAATVAFAQVYVGVHFPADVFCGALVGVTCALIFATLYRSLVNTSVMDLQ